MIACHGPAVTVSGKPRCSGCGHRQPVNGVPPRQTREQPPWQWPIELRDRRRARLVGLRLGLRDNDLEAGVVEPFKITDEEGATIEVRQCDQGEHGYLRVTGEHGTVVSACADPLELPELMVALYRAAGQEPPVMLGRPEIDPEVSAELGPFRIWRAEDGVAVELGRMTTGPLPSSLARQFAAALVAYADAEPGPDPAEVQALTAVLEEADCVTGDTADLARAVLRAGYRREAKPDA